MCQRHFFPVSPSAAEIVAARLSRGELQNALTAVGRDRGSRQLLLYADFSAERNLVCVYVNTCEMRSLSSTVHQGI